jgi:ribonuclease HI
MQDPRTRIYYWADGYDQRHRLCYVSGQDFVRARCDHHRICQCFGFIDLVELRTCDLRYTCDNCGNLSAHGHTIVIATDGACRNNGRADAVAACGVFFNVDSYHNKAFKIPDPRPTSQRAELDAAVYALKAFTKMRASGEIGSKGLVTEVIIKSDSAYLVNGMTSFIVAWRQNGYRNSRGHHLKNQKLFRKLDRLCNNLYGLGIQVRFWRVSREDNQQADKLANAALDGTPWRNLSANDWFGDDELRPYIH